jgi:DNA topoisomerase I
MSITLTTLAGRYTVVDGQVDATPPDIWPGVDEAWGLVALDGQIMTPAMGVYEQADLAVDDGAVVTLVRCWVIRSGDWIVTEAGVYPEMRGETVRIAPATTELSVEQFHADHDQSSHGNWAGGGSGPDIAGLRRIKFGDVTIYSELHDDDWRLDPLRPRKRSESVWVDRTEAQLIRQGPQHLDGPEPPARVMAVERHDGSAESIAAAVRTLFAAPERAEMAVTFHAEHDQSTHGNWAGRSSDTLTTEQMKAEVKALTKAQQARYKALRTKSHHDAMMHAVHGGSDNTGLHEATDAEREALKVPPNQRYVMVADSADGNVNGLVSRGLSGVGGIVPQYSAAHTAAQAAAKYERLTALNDAVPKLDAALERDAMTDPDAAVVAVMRATGLRVDAAGADGRKRTRSGKVTYGASTLEARHVTINKDSVRFKFLGKGSKMVDVTIRDAKLVALMKQWKGTKTHSARLFDTDADRTMNYINSVTGGDFKNHDLRTFKANTIAATTAAKLPKRYRSQSAMDAARRKVGTAVSKVLANEWSTALASYVNPAIFNDWEVVT